jgi:two-component system chemotaxis response regulator CheY
MPSVLIVDDSPTIRRMVKLSLAGLAGDTGFLEASSGLEAIERLALHPVDLMVLDLNMPDMHGLEVLEFMRGHQRFCRVPILVLTTRGDEAARDSALKGGATEFMTKPFVPHALMAAATRAMAAAAGRQTT